ncbi:PREDICTED: nuclear pore complex protein DDB_G0274915-like isoform X2 [Rhagoletis zephyria]|uniref:nuclear pore complex protein DDB_G0274915-like isoform X2 n=1 Tax=Rhagoletis zephyria TaxID=28612 RepID=UPI0008114513|nr:PREDICTED: nuclear pore complex protein DDB_G0274915-like isoform X2 [Rhagoletis zephyria]
MANAAAITAKADVDRDVGGNISATTSAVASPTDASTTSTNASTPISTSNPNASASQNALNDPNHWSKQEKFDADTFLECAYKKHLSRHANKVLLRVRMLYYIQHEVIGDLVQQIKDNTPVSELPIRPPATPDQVPASWWNPACCDKSLLVGTYKHGCEMYRQIRADPNLCFVGHVGAGDDMTASNLATNEDDAISKHEDAEEIDDDGTITKDSDSTKTGDNKDLLDPERPGSSGKSRIRAKSEAADVGSAAAANSVATVDGTAGIANKDQANETQTLNEPDEIQTNFKGLQSSKNSENPDKSKKSEASEQKSNVTKDADASVEKAENELTTVATDIVSSSTPTEVKMATVAMDMDEMVANVKSEADVDATTTTVANAGGDSTSADTTVLSASVSFTKSEDGFTKSTSARSEADCEMKSENETETAQSMPVGAIDSAIATDTNTTATEYAATSTSPVATDYIPTLIPTSNTNEQTQNDTLNSTTIGLDEEESVASSYPPTTMAADDATMWPSMQDLNTRLRRVITAYQRNYKKEELKQQQKAKLQAMVSSTPPLSVPTTPTLQSMQNAAASAAGGGGSVNSGGNSLLQQSNTIEPGNRSLQSLQQNTSIPTASGGVGSGRQTPQQLSTSPSTSAAAAAAAAVVSTVSNVVNVPNICPAMINGSSQHQTQQLQHPPHTPQQQQQQQQQQHAKQQQQQQQHIVAHQQQQQAAAATVAPQMPTAADIGLMLSFLNTTDVSHLANLDLNKLAMYLKIERQGKLELAAKERENQRLQQIPKKWNRREEYEFLRVLTGYGVDLQPSTSLGLVLASDWTKFKQMAHLERKSDETLSDYYKVFIAMCKRKAGVKLNDNERGLEGIFEEISEDHAKLILERLELLSKLREIARHPQLEERLKLCQKNPDTPDWWEPGRHDKELISAVLKHGLYRSETFIFNDPNFSFAESEKRFIRELEAQIQRSIKLESFHADRLPSSIPNVRGEVIDLDDELLTKDSLIKKEQFMPLKTEVKSEVSADGADKLSVGKTEADNETCVVSEETKNKNNDEKSDTNADLSSSKEITDPNTECTGIDSVHELQDEDIKTFNASTDDEINSMQTFENMPKDENEKIDIDGSFIIKKDLDASTAVLDNENYNDMSTSNDVGDGITSTSAKASETAENAEEIQPDKMELNEKEILGKDDKPSCLVIENNKKESGDKADHKEDVINKDSVIISNIEDSRSISSKIEQTIPQNEGAGASSSDEKPKSTADEEILDLAIDATGVADPDDEDIMKEKENSVEEECKKQAAELKARFPDLEVIQPATVKQKQDKPKLEMCMIRWFKDFALERRISHIVICVETNKWPVNRNYTAFVGCKGIDLNICLHEAIPHLKNFERPPSTTDVITITTEQGVSKNLQASQMPLIVPSSTPSIPITTPPAIGANIGMSLLTPPANVAGGDGTGKDIVNVVTPPLDSNSINLAVTAAVAATASGGNNANALSASTLSALLPGMTMTPSSAAAVTALTNSPVVPPRANISSSVSTLTPAAQTTGKKRKRHIAIDVETERAKLHALLNSSQNMGLKDWENEIANMEPPAASPQPTGRRSASSASPVAPTASATNTPLQPPPAHQHASLQRQSSSQFSKPAVPPLKTPPTSIGAPMDLSSSLPRVNMADMLKSASGAIDLSEVQDFSMSSKKAPTSHLQASLNSAFPSMLGKGKLDDTLNKLMKKNNCTIEEPVIGKEKKRKKLDEIVLGLSAAKEQKTFPDPSLPSSKKPQIPPSVSVTPASLQTSVSSQNQQIQKPFTITVTTVPGKSKSGGNTSMPSPAPVASPLSSGLPLMSGGLSLKDINAIVAQTMASDPQTLLKQQQKMMQCLPPAQRKAYEAMLAEMEQAMKLSAKYNVPDLKVNKWLTDMSTPLSDQLNMDFSPVASTSSNTNNRRSNRQQSSNSGHQSSVSQLNKAAAGQSAQQSHAHHQQQQQQPAMAGPQGLTGEEPVPVVNKQTGKRISGSKAPQLKRLMQWLTENPAYEVDPKWLEQIQNPMSIPSPKLSSMDTSNYALSSKTTHGGRPSSTTSSSSSGAHTQQQQSSSAQSSPAPSPTVSSKKSSRQSAIDQANAAMQFGSLAGLNPNLLASLPSLGAFDPKNALGAFDPKNPLLSMPFAGMPGMSNIPGLNNLNSMNLFASLASMGGLGNLATMDPQTLAALMAAGSALAGLGNTNPSPGSSSTGKNSQSGGSSSKKNKNDAQQNAMMNLGALASNTGSSGSTGNGTGNSSNKNANAAAASQLTGCFPYLFPNPSLLYPPMGLGGLNPYSLGSAGLGSAYDQLAQQYNLLNGGTGVTSSAGSSSTTQSKSHQSQSKSSNSRASTSSSPSAASVANLMNAMASIGAAGQPTTSVSSSQSSSRSSGRQSAASRAAAQVAEMAQLSSLLLPGTDPHLLESLSRMDLAQSTRLLSSLGIPPITATAPQLSSSDKRSSNSNSAASIAAAQAAQAEKQAAKEQQKWMESLARSQLPTDLATLQAFSQSKFPASLSGGSQSTSTSSSASTSSASTSKNASKAAAAALAAQLPQILGLPSDFAPAMIADMAQALTAPGSLASLAGLTMPPTSSASSIGGSSSSSSSKRQRGGSGGGNSSNMLDPDALTKDAFKQQMEYYTKTLGLGSGISLIPTSSMSSSGVTNSISNAQIDEHHKSKRSRLDSHAAALANAKDELSAAMLASGLPLNLGGGMASMEKSLRGVNVGMGGNGGATMPEADKVTLTPLNSAGIAANLPSQTTITIAPPISSGASSSSERSERSESRISLTITNAADAAKLPPPYEEADELIIQPILKKPQNIPTSAAPSAASSSHGSAEDLEAAVATNMGGGATSVNTTPTPSTSAAAAAAAAVASANEEHRRSSSRLKRPRTGADHSGNEQPPEKRRELRSTRHTRQSSGSLETTLNLSTNNEAEEKNE